MRRLITMIAAMVLMAVALATGSSAAVAAPAAAAPDAGVNVGCYGDYCSGQDPESTGCSADAYTVRTAGVGGYLLELRWSPTCKTNWARISAGYGGSLWVVQTTGYKQGSSSSNGSFRWTRMIYSPSLLCRGEAGSTYTGWA